MAHPVEEVVGNPYKPMVRFVIAAAAIITVVMVSSDRAKGFVDERISQKTQVIEATAQVNSDKIEKMDTRLQGVQEDVAVIKEQVSQIRDAVQSRRK